MTNLFAKNIMINLKQGSAFGPGRPNPERAARFFRVRLRDRDEVFAIGLKIFGIGMIKIGINRADLVPIGLGSG